jgi:hypothetical protein
MITLLLVAVALGFLFWPKGVTNPLPKFAPAEDLFRVPPLAAKKPEAPPAPAARDAIDSLLEVRDRLAATDALDEDSTKAVDVLWLDLLHGSKK